MAQKRYLIWGLVLVIATSVAVMGFLWSADDFVPATVRSSPSSKQVVAPAASIETKTETKSSEGSDHLKPRSNSMSPDFAQAVDWRAFALEALRRPEEGGYMYARYIALECSTPQRREASSNGIQETVARGVALMPAQLQMMEDVDRRCASFATGEAESLFSDVSARIADGRDPYVNSLTQVDKVLSGKLPANELSSAFSKLLSNESLALSGMLNRVSAFDSEARSVQGYYFEGRVYGRNDPEYLLLDAALHASTCDATARCPADSFRELLCINAGQCYSSREEFFRRTAKLDDTQFEKFREFERKLRQAIEERRVQAFVR